MRNREISAGRIDWFLPRSSSSTRGRSPGGRITPPPLTVRVMRNALTGWGLNKQERPFRKGWSIGKRWDLSNSCYWSFIYITYSQNRNQNISRKSPSAALMAAGELTCFLQAISGAGLPSALHSRVTFLPWSVISCPDSGCVFTLGASVEARIHRVRCLTLSTTSGDCHLTRAPLWRGGGAKRPPVRFLA